MTQRLPTTFGEAVKQRRTELALSQRALAAKIAGLGIPMDATAVTRIENGLREPRFSEGIVLCEFLGIDGTAYAAPGAVLSGYETATAVAYQRAAEAVVELVGTACQAIDHLYVLGERGKGLFENDFVAPVVPVEYESRAAVGEALCDSIIRDPGHLIGDNGHIESLLGFDDETVRGARRILDTMIDSVWGAISDDSET